MEKYLCKIVYKIECGSEAPCEQYDEQLCIIEARDEREAFIKARLLGVKNEAEVNHISGKGIFWKFVDVPFLNRLVSLSDGDEIYSAICEKEMHDNYERYVKLRAAELQIQLEKQIIEA